MNRYLATLCASTALVAMPCAAATVTVADASGAYAAVKAATPGDTVLLASGGYLELDNFKIAAPGVTLKPKPGSNVVLTQVVLNGSQGINLQGFEVIQGASSWMPAVYAANASNLSFDGLHVHQTGAAFVSNGLQLRNTTDSSVTNSEFDHLGLALALIDDQRITLRGNTVHDTTADAFDLFGTSASIVDGNTFHDFTPAADVHPDAIQFASTATNPLPSDNVVTNNVFRRGAGQVAQGIFVESQKNLTITGNGLSGTMFNGISLSGVQGGVVAGNFVQGWSDMGSWIIARGGSTGLTISGNTLSQALVIGATTASEKAPSGLTLGATTLIPVAKVGDSSALDAWLAKKPGPPAPPISTAPDPRDAQIASLTAQLSAATSTSATAAKALGDAQSALATQTAADQGALKAAGATNAALSARIAAAVADLTKP